MIAVIGTVLVWALIAVVGLGAAFCAILGFMILINYKG
ncbi:hypothetical protein STW0522KLE44_20660 [Klebsiella sp. STW0522-44]|nr:hypothetical protein STW0522KLE44_20660 [Klebsiella sp. STW0522-44]